MKGVLIVISLAGLVLSVPAQAEQVYKHIDAAGNVSYSDRPPSGANANPMKLPDSPSPEQQEEATEREKQLRAEADKLSKAREGGAGKDKASDKEQSSGTKPREPAAGEEPESYYPTYQRPLLRPRPPGGSVGEGDHPIYTPPGERPTNLPAIPSPLR